MKISYAIPVCNEINEIKRLTEFLLEHKNEQDEIVILVDELNHTQEVKDYVETFAEECIDQNVIRAYYPLNKDFASFKNHLNSLCSGDYIYQVDADEMLDEYVVRILPQVLAHNAVDMIRVPRINTVKGLTEEHIKKWGWRVDEKGRVNFPDYQTRIYKNSNSIEWSGKVHEIIVGAQTISHLPLTDEWCLIHDKDIKRQEKQNDTYSKL
jgi:glycosyltransferase involved in cell wall biosynthesis